MQIQCSDPNSRQPLASLSLSGVLRGWSPATTPTSPPLARGLWAHSHRGLDPDGQQLAPQEPGHLIVGNALPNSWAAQPPQPSQASLLPIPVHPNSLCAIPS